MKNLKLLKEYFFSLSSTGKALLALLAIAALYILLGVIS